MESLDSSYNIPGARTINTELDELFQKCRDSLKELMNNAKRLCFTTDIWSQKGSLRSFLGVTAHYFERKSDTKKRIVISVCECPHPHTGERIKSLFLDNLKEYDIEAELDVKQASENIGTSCYCHTLQLVVNKVLQEPKVKRVCKKAKKN